MTQIGARQTEKRPDPAASAESPLRLPKKRGPCSRRKSGGIFRTPISASYRSLLCWNSCAERDIGAGITCDYLADVEDLKAVGAALLNFVVSAAEKPP
jgi:hypothetical protein